MIELLLCKHGNQRRLGISFLSFLPDTEESEQALQRNACVLTLTSMCKKPAFSIGRSLLLFTDYLFKLPMKPLSHSFPGHGLM